MRVACALLPSVLAVLVFSAPLSAQDQVDTEVLTIRARSGCVGGGYCFNLQDLRELITAEGRKGYSLVSGIGAPFTQGNATDDAHFGVQIRVQDPNASIALVFQRRTSSQTEERLRQMERDVRTQLEALRNMRQDLLRIVQEGLAASLVERYQAPLRQDICRYVERRLNERLPPPQPGAPQQPAGTDVCASQ